MIYGSVCSGIEAATVAWHPLGWRAAWYSEIEPFPCKLLAHHYPEVPNLGDMTKLEQNQLFNDSTINLLVGGTPCQSFSLAGLRGGLADGRGNLALVYCRLLLAKKPRWFVWENVPGVFSSWSDDPDSKVQTGEADEREHGGGYDCTQTSDFATLLEAFRECGYSVTWRVLDSQYFGVTQRRRRVFVVGHLGDDWRPSAAVLLEPEGLRGNPAKVKKAGQEVAGTLTAGADRRRGAGQDTGQIVGTMPSRESGGGGFGTDAEADGYVQPVKEIVGSLSAKNPIRAGVTEVDAGLFTPVNLPDKVGALDTQCGGEKLAGQSATMGHLIQGIGFDLKSVVKPGNRSNLDDKQPTLNTAAGASVMIQDKEATLNKSETIPENSVLPSVTAKDAKLYQPKSALEENWEESDVKNALRADESKSSHVLAFNKNDIKPEDRSMQGVVSPTIKQDGGASVVIQEIGEDVNEERDRQVMPSVMQVRRLTPLECERLQGFPDNYTNIPKAAEGPRYKSLGNSMTTDVMEWIGRRIDFVDKLLNKTTTA